jgi:hypothetical protein
MELLLLSVLKIPGNKVAVISYSSFATALTSGLIMLCDKSMSTGWPNIVGILFGL